MFLHSSIVIVASLLSACLFAVAVFFVRSKFKFSRMSITVGWIHLVFVLLNALMTEVDMLEPGHGEALMGWLWFDLFDFPSSLLALLVSTQIYSFFAREVLLPILFYGVAGSFQYLLVSELFMRFLCQTFKAIGKKC